MKFAFLLALLIHLAIFATGVSTVREFATSIPPASLAPIVVESVSSSVSASQVGPIPRKTPLSVPSIAPRENSNIDSARPRESRPHQVTEEEMVAGGNERPTYPEEAILQGWEGQVQLRIAFRGEQAASARVEQSSGYRLLDDAALSAAERWKLPSGIQDRWGDKVEELTDVRVSIAFKLVD